MLLSFTDAFKQYGGNVIFSGLSLTLNYGDKVGLVGINGSGKSTLIKAMAGEVELDGGTITKKKGLKIGYVEQMQSVNRDLSVYSFVYDGNDYIVNLEKKIEHAEKGEVSDPHLLTSLFEEFEKADGYKYRAKVEETLKGIGIFHLRDRRVSALSGGELRRVYLARVLVSDAELLLFDEPTNHLDLFAVNWFKDYLINTEKAFVLVSHDEYLLNGTVGKIVEINAGRVFFFNGDYRFYRKKREELALQAEREYRNRVEEIEREMEFVRKNIAGQKTKQAKSRLKKIEKIDVGERRLFKDISIKLKFNETEKRSKYIARCESLAVGYGTPLVKGIDLLIQRGEKYGIVGRNGSGKTTFLKTLVGKLKPLSGSVKIYPDIRVGYFDQNIEFEDEEETVINTLWNADPSLKRDEVLNYLAYFYFRKEMVESRVKFLSGGERSRLKLACLMLGEYDLLILDEPTNHLDILLTEAITEAVRNFKGSVLTVSHHRYFLDSTVNKVIELKNGKFSLFHGGISYYFEKAKDSEQSHSRETGEKKSAQAPKDRQKKRDGISKNERLRAKWRLEEVEKEIEKLENRKKEIESMLAMEEIVNDYIKIKSLSDELSSIDEKLDSLLNEWQRLSEICMS